MTLVLIIILASFSIKILSSLTAGGITLLVVEDVASESFENDSPPSVNAQTRKLYSYSAINQK